MAHKILLISIISIIIAKVMSTQLAPTVGLFSDVVSGQLTILNDDNRHQIEEQILKSTVRIRIDTWVVKADETGYEINAAYSHATLKDGRYLVTHNHFSVPQLRRSGAEQPEVYAPEVYAAVTLANSGGEALYEGPLSDFEVVWEDPETLVITHQDAELFERLGFVSAQFQDWSSASLAAGAEVAQVDWDGVTTRVDWATVQEVHVEDGMPRLVLADDITLGASGGGIFWEGVHVANNWLQVQEIDQSGELLNSTTKAALNSTQVAGQPGQVLASGSFILAGRLQASE